ncbi:DUF2062 domain-containing protein [Candidatus Babeliales bacterium]|nr:DUF2062 domain-containing protein [Candidatus Babeliales bacterium]
MSLIQKAKNLFSKALHTNNTPAKLAVSFCIGIYIAFSPFPGGHTVMMFAFTWLFGLNFPILFFATSFNNPWTAIPFYAADYSFGYWFTHSFLGLNPAWAFSFERFLGSSKICLWSFFIGGNVLGILFAIICYPLVLRLFLFLDSKVNKARV